MDILCYYSYHRHLLDKPVGVPLNPLVPWGVKLLHRPDGTVLVSAYGVLVLLTYSARTGEGIYCVRLVVVMVVCRQLRRLRYNLVAERRVLGNHFFLSSRCFAKEPLQVLKFRQRLLRSSVLLCLLKILTLTVLVLVRHGCLLILRAGDQRPQGRRQTVEPGLLQLNKIS